MSVKPEVLAAFVAASFVLLVVPGPTIVMVISQALAHGKRIALATVIGVGLGDLCAATLSLIGVGTVLAASAVAFAVIKWVGAGYLIWIGIKMWRQPVTPARLELEARSVGSKRWPVFRDAFLVTLFNPKGIVFFIAFVPQFITPTHAFAPQAAIFVSVFVLLGMVNALGYALLASSARQIVKKRTVLQGATRVGSLFLISAGFASLFVRRST